jgi:hypothetical protein
MLPSGGGEHQSINDASLQDRFDSMQQARGPQCHQQHGNGDSAAPGDREEFGEHAASLHALCEIQGRPFCRAPFLDAEDAATRASSTGNSQAVAHQSCDENRFHNPKV